jgi:uncharacterized NAD(P)/FAD-binding protein YdhS
MTQQGPSDEQRPAVAVIGGGASGVLAAVHFLAAPAVAPARFVLFERSGKVGAGAAFSTPHQSHVLNVPAGGMSAFQEDPGHFARWLDRKGHLGVPDDFVPRQLYHSYLRDTLRALAGANKAGHVLEVRSDEVVDIEPTTRGALIWPARGQPVRADVVVLALGVVPSRFRDGLVADGANARCLTNPWDVASLAAIEPCSTVTLLGTGLSAVDVLLALQENGHRGPVQAISRHGLLPHAHVARTSAATGMAPGCPEFSGATARGLLKQVRTLVAGTEAQGGDWRDVVDLVRPRAQELWMGLSTAEQLRFKRYLERFWSVHRHRMAPEVAAQVERLSERGLFHVHAGHVLAVEPAPSSLRLAVRTHSSGRVRHWSTDWLVNCSGPDPNVFRQDQVLMNRLRSRGWARPGPLGIGVETDLAGKVIGTSGRPADCLWAIGSLRQGQLFESTAVPEIRLQAQDLAAQLRGRLRSVSPGYTLLEGAPRAANY